MANSFILILNGQSVFSKTTDFYTNSSFSDFSELLDAAVTFTQTGLAVSGDIINETTGEVFFSIKAGQIIFAR